MAVCAQLGGPVRPTFCNVPMWAQAFLYLAGFVAIGLFAHGIWRHWSAWRAGQGEVPERNLGHRRERFGFFLRYVLGQNKTVERRVPAVFHTGIFWGFILLLIGTILATLDWDVAHLFFDTQFLAGPVYLVYELVLDAAGLFLTLGIFIAMWRRYFVAPHHVAGSWDFVLWSLLLVNVTGFMVEGLRLAIAPVDWGGWSFVGQMIADLIFVAGPRWLLGDVLAYAHLGLWLLHAVAAFAFIAAIPYTNAVHMVTAATNAVLQPVGSLAPGAALQPLDIENAETYGVGSLLEFNWKQRLGFDSCLRCGRCETVCPAFMAGTPLNPKRVIVNLSDGLRHEVDLGRTPIGHSAGVPLIGTGEALVDPDALWACTTCMACVEVCPAFIEIVDDIVDMRRYLALTEGTLPGTAGATLRNMANVGNPWGYAPEERSHWAAGLDVPFAEPGTHVDVLYFVGCSASYDKRNQRIAKAVIQLMQRAGVSFAILEKERCNAESGRRLGEEYLYQTATLENVEQLSAMSFDRVVCHCPHCFNTIANEYPQFGGNYEVVHHTQLIGELVAAGRLPSLSGANQRVAFHDSCYLGRYNGEYEAPRATLQAAGVELLEMDRSRENGLCCGGGGGKMWFEGPQARAVGEIRMEEAMSKKPDVVGVACPFCLTMLDSARSSMGADVKIMDVSEIYAAALNGEAAQSEESRGES